MKRNILALMVTLLLCAPAFADDAAPPSRQTLDLDDCVEIALSRNPEITAARGSVSAAEAVLGQARTADNPSLSFSSSWTTQRTASTSVTDDSFSSSVGLSQLVTDWGKTHAAVKQKASARDRVAFQARGTVIDVIYDVRESYYQLLKAQGAVEVAEETLELNDIQLAQAMAFFDVGAVSKYDVTTARVAQGRARLTLIQAKTDMADALVALKTAMGVPESADFEIEDVRQVYVIDIEPEEALERALANRPDLLAVKAQEDVSRAALTVSRLGNTPELSLTGSYSWGDTQFTGNDSWRTGVTLSFSLYDGGLQSQKTTEARANLQVAEANTDAARNDVMKEVQQAWLGYRDSLESVQVAQAAFGLAEENLDIATGRYRVGVGSPVEVQDATQQFSEAKNEYLGELYDHLIAVAALHHVVGGDIQ